MKTYKALLLLILICAGVNPSYADKKVVTLKVEGMTCSSCPYQVKTALKKVEGVDSATVSLETRLATVSFDDALTNEASLVEATENAGFPSTLITAD